MGWASGPPVLEVQERTRANLEAGARSRFRTRTKVAVTVLLIALLVGSCAWGIWLVFGQYNDLRQRIVDHSNGAVSTVVILGAGDTAIVQVMMARGVSDPQAIEIVCGEVVPELAAAGIHNPQLQIWATTFRMFPTSTDPCALPTPTRPPASPQPNSG
jgi:predicted RNase H-related nuclease YkuK (DUF458 family)